MDLREGDIASLKWREGQKSALQNSPRDRWYVEEYGKREDELAKMI